MDAWEYLGSEDLNWIELLTGNETGLFGLRVSFWFASKPGFLYAFRSSCCLLLSGFPLHPLLDFEDWDNTLLRNVGELYQSTQPHITGENILHFHRNENLNCSVDWTVCFSAWLIWGRSHRCWMCCVQRVIIKSNELKSMRKEAVVAYFMVLCLNFPTASVV
jgi:hypothetical protein